MYSTNQRNVSILPQLGSLTSEEQSYLSNAKFLLVLLLSCIKAKLGSEKPIHYKNINLLIALAQIDIVKL